MGRTHVRVAIAAALPDPTLARLKESCQTVDLLPHVGDTDTFSMLLADAEGLITTALTPLPRPMLESASRLRAISSTGVGYDNIDIPYATSRGIAVCTAAGVLEGAVADLTFALILAVARRLQDQEQIVRTGAWRSAAHPLLGTMVRGKTLGIIGLGHVGRLVAHTASGFDMRVIYFAPRRDRRAEASGYAVYRSRDRLFREADFVTIHCRLDDTTRSSVGSREFGLMKRTAFLINTARGAIVDQPALVQALREGGIAGAGLDVMEVEPLDPEDPICKVPNVVLLPHIGSATMETRRAMAERSVDNLLAVLSGNRPHGLLNAEVLS